LRIGEKHGTFVKKAIDNFVQRGVVKKEIGEVWRKQFSVQEGEKIGGGRLTSRKPQIPKTPPPTPTPP